MSKIIDGIIGHAIGDAMGVPIEGHSRGRLLEKPVTKMMDSLRGNKGTWSDDTSMTIATMDSYINSKKWDYDDIMHNFISWLNNGKYTAAGKPIGVGRTCLTAIKQYYNGNTSALESGLDAIDSNGNGSLMRMYPVAYYCYYKKLNNNDIYDLVKNISSLTHRHEVSILGCYIYTLFVIRLLKGIDKYKAYKEIKEEDYSMFSNESLLIYKRILKDDLNTLFIDDIRSTGYVVDTLEASLWVLLKSNSYKDSIVGSINLGNDTDTIGAITGSMSGIIYGYDNIPKDWLDSLIKKDYIIDLCNKYEKEL